MNTAYVGTSRGAAYIHAHPECEALAAAVEIVPVDPVEYVDYGRCRACMDEPRHPADHDGPAAIPPARVDCPCGDGIARLKPRQIVEPFHKNKSQRAVLYCYRHEGCPIGGVIVTVSGKIRRSMGPLFEPERFGVGREYTTMASD